MFGIEATETMPTLPDRLGQLCVRDVMTRHVIACTRVHKMREKTLVKKSLQHRPRRERQTGLRRTLVNKDQTGSSVPS